MYTGDKKTPPTDFRLKICDGCSHRAWQKAEEIPQVLEVQEAAKEEFFRNLKEKHARLEFGIGFGDYGIRIMLPADADADIPGGRFRRVLVSPSATINRAPFEYPAYSY